MMNRLLFLTAVTAALATNSLASTPLQVGQTYNTGYVGATPIGAGLPDLNFTLYNSSTGITNPVVGSPIPAVWVAPSGAQWISPSEDQTYPSNTPEGNAPGIYDYNAQLATNFLVPTSITITGGFAADNTVTLFINGTQVTSVAAPAYGSLTNFSYTFTLSNTGAFSVPIDFVVTNFNDTNGTVNPTGLIVSGLKATSTSAPEPTTWLMLFAGAGALFFVQRARRASIL